MSAVPVIASSSSLLSAGNSRPVSGHLPISAGCAEMSGSHTVKQNAGQRCRRAKRKSDVTVATGCGSGGITTATDSNNATRGIDNVPSTQKQSVASVPSSASSIMNNTSIGHAGRSVVTGKRHSELAQRHSAVGQLEKQLSAVTNFQQRESTSSGKTEPHARGSSAVTTTCWATTTVKLPSHTTITQPPRVLPKDPLVTASDAFIYPRDCLAAVSAAMYTSDCTVPMFWLPDQPVTSNDDEKEDDAGCKLMMSPASFHFVPLIAAPHPYPCIEPMYVDMATVGMAAVGVATEHVGMAVADIGMETDSVAMSAGGIGMAMAGMAGGQVGHCLVSVDDDVTPADAFIWPPPYPCCDGSLPALAQPRVDTPASFHPSAQFADDSTGSTACQTQLVGSTPTASTLASVSLAATAVSHAAPTVNLPDSPEPSLTLSDNPCGTSVLMMDVASTEQSALEDGDAVVAEDGNNEPPGSGGGGQVSDSSRPDVVSSNIPRSHMDQPPQQLRQQDDDDENADDEMSCDAPVPSVDELPNNVDQQPPPPPSPSAAANVDT